MGPTCRQGSPPALRPPADHKIGLLTENSSLRVTLRCVCSPQAAFFAMWAHPLVAPDSPGRSLRRSQVSFPAWAGQPQSCFSGDVLAPEQTVRKAWDLHHAEKEWNKQDQATARQKAPATTQLLTYTLCALQPPKPCHCDGHSQRKHTTTDVHNQIARNMKRKQKEPPETNQATLRAPAFHCKPGSDHGSLEDVLCPF